MANQTGDGSSPIETLSATGQETTAVSIPKGPFNLHVYGDGEGSWRPYVSYDGGISWIPLEVYYEAKKLTPQEGDSLVSGGVLYKVVAEELAEGTFWHVRIGS